jgi:hypothetical protein
MNTPTQFPIEDEDAQTWVSRADYCAMRFGQLAKQYPDAGITVKQVKDSLGLLENGMANPADLTDWQREIADDLTLAKERDFLENENLRLVDIPDQPEESDEIPNQDSAELAVIEAANTGNLGLGLGEVLTWFDLGPSLTQCKPTEHTTDIQIGRGIEVLAGVKNWSELGIGDLLNALEDRGHGELIPQIISQIGLEESYPTIQRYRVTARAVSNDLRELPNIKFSHLAEVATSRFSKDPAKQAETIREVLIEASERGYNVSQTREACLNRKGKETAPTPPPKKTYRYLVFTPDCGRTCCGEFTNVEPHTEPGQVVFDLQEMMASSSEVNGYHCWVPIPQNSDEIGSQDDEIIDP